MRALKADIVEECGIQCCSGVIGEWVVCGVDSRVCLGAYSKGSSSSLMLNGILRTLMGYQLAGWLGGYSDQGDRAEVVLQLFDSAGVALATETLPAVTSSERDDETGLRLRTRFGMIPPFTRSARVTVNMYRSSGYNDGYADNLVFLMTEGK